ncbi:MAG: putative metallopeptidase [Steroidobacteraceae bacterium]
MPERPDLAPILTDAPAEEESTIATFASAPDVEKIARELIPQYHTHLAEARIAYRARVSGEGQEWRSRGHLVWGKAVAVSGPVRELTGDGEEPYDFMLIVNGDIWFALSETGHKAVVDHQLSHMQRSDGGVFSIGPHDAEEFGPVVVRWGLWNPDLEHFAAAIQDAPGSRQLRLPVNDAAAAGEAAAPPAPARPADGQLTEDDALQALADAHRGELADTPNAEEVHPETGDNVRPLDGRRRRQREHA